MKLRAWMAVPLLMCSGWACAAGEAKAVSSLYDLQADSYRYARLQRELVTPVRSDLLGRVRKQLKKTAAGLNTAATEAKPGMDATGMQAQQQQIAAGVSDYLATAGTAKDLSELAPARAKRMALLKSVAGDVQQLVAKLPPKTGSALTAAGQTKIDIERLAYDYEFCGAQCATTLPTDLAAIQRGLDGMHASMGASFDDASLSLAKNQLILLKPIVDARIQAGVNEDSQSSLIMTCAQLWEVVDRANDAAVVAAN
jgi:hypothetical protein